MAQLGGSVVNVQVEKTSWNSRKLYASVNINAPVSLVWNCLTDYEGLSSFIPSLVENRCLQQKSNGAVVYQVGAASFPQQWPHAAHMHTLKLQQAWQQQRITWGCMPRP